jgi:hypothetical protein
VDTVCCVAKVKACNSCASNKASSESASQLVKTMRNTMVTAQINNQFAKLKVGNQRPWVKNHTISAKTDTAHNTPIMVLLYPRCRGRAKNTYIPMCEST